MLHDGGAILTLHNGIIDVYDSSLYYEISGQGPGLVLIHGNMLDSRMWRFNVGQLSRDHTVIAYDMKGYGKSGAKGRHIGAAVDDLRALLDHLNIEKTVVCGTSMGGVAALHFALLHPERTSGLILVDSDLSRFAISGEFAEPILATQQALERGDKREAVRIWLDHAMLRDVKNCPAAYELLLEMVNDYEWRDWLIGRGYLIDPPALERLDQVTAPTLVMVGERDLQRFHAIAQLLTREIPNCESLVMEGVSHLPNMERPEEFNRLVLDFTKRCCQSDSQ
ncbi:MAG: alpha/beta hydrolase [Sedimentisphaerales bacterium]|nr:alpha/beta hydrolase [Sedimentisphaerales bacterium]